MFDKLNKWRDERNIQGYNHKTQVLNIYEELLELIGYEETDYLKEHFADSIFEEKLEPLNKDKVDAFCDLIVFSVNAIELMGYDAEKCMQETIKEIESRTGAMNPNTGKWEKFKTDEAKALWYKADYDKCRN